MSNSATKATPSPSYEVSLLLRSRWDRRERIEGVEMPSTSSWKLDPITRTSPDRILFGARHLKDGYTINRTMNLNRPNRLGFDDLEAVKVLRGR